MPRKKAAGLEEIARIYKRWRRPGIPPPMLRCIRMQIWLTQATTAQTIAEPVLDDKSHAAGDCSRKHRQDWQPCLSQILRAASRRLNRIVIDIQVP